MQAPRFQVSTFPQSVGGPEPLVRRLHKLESVNAVLALAMECENFVESCRESMQITQSQAEAMYRLFDQEVNAKLNVLQRVNMLSFSQLTSH